MEENFVSVYERNYLIWLIKLELL